MKPVRTEKVGVLIVDDHMIVRRGLTSLLSAFDDVQVVGEADDGDQGVQLYAQTQPDVVLMDLKMPRLDGITTIKRIIESHPAARILVLTGFIEDALIQHALQAGAIGYLLKNITADELHRAVLAAHEGRRTFSPEAAGKLVDVLNHDPKPPQDLTDREREVLALMVAGLNNAEIASRLVLSVSTIKFHVSAILAKLGAVNRVDAVARAVRCRLLETLPQSSPIE